MELGGVLRARRAPTTGGKEEAQGRLGAMGTLTWPRGAVATASPQQPHSEGSRREELPAGGSKRLGERKKREAEA